MCDAESARILEGEKQNRCLRSTGGVSKVTCSCAERVPRNYDDGATDEVNETSLVNHNDLTCVIAWDEGEDRRGKRTGLNKLMTSTKDLSS